MKEANILADTEVDFELPLTQQAEPSPLISNFASLTDLTRNRTAVKPDPVAVSSPKKHPLTIEQVRLKLALVRAREAGCTAKQAMQIIDSVYAEQGVW